MADFVAYYRVLTDRQGISGLGLDAQRASVQRYLDLAPGQALAAAFTEIENGRRNTNRPHYWLRVYPAARIRLRATEMAAFGAEHRIPTVE